MTGPTDADLYRRGSETLLASWEEYAPRRGRHPSRRTSSALPTTRPSICWSPGSRASSSPRRWRTTGTRTAGSTTSERWSGAPGRLGTLRAERDALVGELTHAAGLSGRRRAAGSSAERARIAVQKAIVAAIDRVGTVDAATARHLRTTVHTGLHCSYDPDPDTAVHWLLD